MIIQNINYTLLTLKSYNSHNDFNEVFYGCNGIDAKEIERKFDVNEYYINLINIVEAKKLNK